MPKGGAGGCALNANGSWLENAQKRAKADCRAHTVNWRDRALAAEKKAEIDADRANVYRDKWQAAEKQLATLAERVKALKHGHSPECTSTREDMHSVLCICGGSRYIHNRAIDAAVAAILNDKETK